MTYNVPAGPQTHSAPPLGCHIGDFTSRSRKAPFAQACSGLDLRKLTILGPVNRDLPPRVARYDRKWGLRASPSRPL